MQYNRTLLETADEQPLFWEKDVHGAITADWLNGTNYAKSYVLLSKMGSESVGNAGLQILQATDNNGTGAKILTVYRAWYKTGTLTAQGVWTALIFNPKDDFLGFGSTNPGGSTYPSTVNTRAVANVGTNQLQLLVEIANTDLDETNGFKYYSAFVDPANLSGACLMTAQALPFQPSYAGAIPVDPTL